MQVQPYEPESVRKIRKWNAAAKAIGFHVIILRKVYIDRWFVGMDSKDFLRYVTQGKPKKLKSLSDHDTSKFLDKVVEACQAVMLAESELSTEEYAWHLALREHDFSDLMYYRLKEMIQVGDEWQADETKTFTFSDVQYITKGKRYAIQTLRDDEGSEFGITTTTDVPGETNWVSHYGIKSIWRNGEEIWSWNKAYLALWLEQNPDHPQTQEMIDHLSKPM